MTDIGTRLGIHDTEVLAEFLTYHMSQETRGKLMAEHPVLYAKLCPGVPAGTILARSADAIRAARADADSRRAAALAEVEREAHGRSGEHDEGAGGQWFTREAVQAAFGAAVGEATRIAGEDRVLDIIPGVFADEMNALPVSRDQAVTVFGNAADTCKDDYNPEAGETTDTIRSDSVGDLIVNLAIGLLGNPGRDADAIIAESWADLADVSLDEFQVWNQHASDDGAHCPYSGRNVTPASREQLMTGLDPADERCPQGCPGSHWTDPERGTDAHTAAIAATVKGWVA